MVTSQTLENFHDAVLANDDILFFDEDFNKVSFFANQMVILAVELDKIVLDHDDNDLLMKMILILLLIPDFWLGIVNFKNAKHVKKDIPKRINACKVESKKKKEIETIFNDKAGKC